MYRSIIAFLLLGFPSFMAAQGQDLDEYFSNLIDEAGIPGLSIALIEDGQISYAGALGVRSTDTREPVDERTIFDAASLSKPVFAVGVMKLVEEGKFDLDKPLCEYLPYPDIEADERYKTITGRMALSHSAGFPNWRNGDLELIFTPGERYSYSGEGFVYLQKVIEKVTGRPMDEWMQETFFQPLGMKRSGYVWRESFEGNYAIPHGDRMETYKKRKPQEGNTAYSLQTTAGDYARFVQAVLNQEILNEATTGLMLTKQVQAAESFGAAAPLSEHVGWALGWGVEETKDHRYFWQWGDNGAFKGFVMFDRAAGKGVVYFANSTHGLTIAPAICERVFGEEHPVFSWLSYGSYDAPVRQLERAIQEKGLDQAMNSFMDKNGKHQDTTLIAERDMNSLGYRLMSQKRYQDAKRIFQLNMAAFPNSANVYDSYAEACLRSGDREGAAKYYARAAEMEPDNEVAASISRQLTEPMTGKVTFSLDGYPNANLVSLAGEFNGWQEWKNIMQRRNGEWVCELDLEPGKYQYKFIVDGVWILDPGNPESVYEGHHNSVVEVK